MVLPVTSPLSLARGPYVCCHCRVRVRHHSQLWRGSAASSSLYRPIPRQLRPCVSLISGIRALQSLEPLQKPPPPLAGPLDATNVSKAAVGTPGQNEPVSGPKKSKRRKKIKKKGAQSEHASAPMEDVATIESASNSRPGGINSSRTTTSTVEASEGAASVSEKGSGIRKVITARPDSTKGTSSIGAKHSKTKTSTPNTTRESEANQATDAIGAKKASSAKKASGAKKASRAKKASSAKKVSGAKKTSGTKKHSGAKKPSGVKKSSTEKDRTVEGSAAREFTKSDSATENATTTGSTFRIVSSEATSAAAQMYSKNRQRYQAMEAFAAVKSPAMSFTAKESTVTGLVRAVGGAFPVTRPRCRYVVTEESEPLVATRISHEGKPARDRAPRLHTTKSHSEADQPGEIDPSSTAPAHDDNTPRPALIDKARNLFAKVRRTLMGSQSSAQGQESETYTSRREAGGQAEAVEAEKDVPDRRMRFLKSKDLVELKLLESTPSEIPHLSYGLDRVLFNPGVYSLRDPRSRVYNFDPYLEKIMPIAEFDFSALAEYTTSSKDRTLLNIARQHGKKYIGSTSSMTACLSHFHFLLSNWRPVDTSLISRGYPSAVTTFTRMTRAPAAVFLRWKNGTYAIDADKEFDTSNVLMMLGKSMEKLLCLPKQQFERYRKGSSEGVPKELAQKPEAYHHSVYGDFLMRSQLDAYDPRLPGTGVFDLKSRAVLPVRMDVDEYEAGGGYEISRRFGEFYSFEREYHDILRSVMLKYSLQVRMGQMDGIFLAYHNVERMFGFQYLGLDEMDQGLHGQGQPQLGDEEFKFSLSLLNKVLNRVTSVYPEQTIRLHFETRPTQQTCMYIFAEPVTDEEADKIQSTNAARAERITRTLLARDKQRNNDSTPETEACDGLGAVQYHATTDAHEDEGVRAAPVTSEMRQESDIAHPQESDERAIPSLPSGDNGQENASHSTIAVDEPPKDDDNRPLLGFTLITYNEVNGQKVERPERLNQKDQWTLRYSLEPFATQARAWRTYRACQARRKTVLDEQSPEENQVEREPRPFLKLMRRLSEKGREWRAVQDSMDLKRGRQNIVFQPLDAEAVENAGGTSMLKSRATKQVLEEELS